MLLEKLLDEQEPRRWGVVEVLAREKSEAVDELVSRIQNGLIGSTTLHQMLERLHEYHDLTGKAPSEYQCRQFVKKVRENR